MTCSAGKRIEDGGNLIGLYDAKGGGAISLEPGGQFELSGAPLEDAHATAEELYRHLAVCRAVAEPLGMGFLALGMSPKWTLAQTPSMPKSRYAIMARYMPKVGTRGLDMMFRTATVQANLDYMSEKDMVAKLRVAAQHMAAHPRNYVAAGAAVLARMWCPSSVAMRLSVGSFRFRAATDRKLTDGSLDVEFDSRHPCEQIDIDDPDRTSA